MDQQKTVAAYLAKHQEWKAPLRLLRQLLKAEDFEETIKWGFPVYTVQGKNVAGLGAFKSYVGIWFFQGALLADKAQKLHNAQEGKTQAMRQWRFHDLESIERDKALISGYLKEAIANQVAGKEVKPAKAGKKPLIIPAELQDILNKDASLKAAFEDLTLGKQREYTEYIETAKREATKQGRLDKILPMITDGIGLNDKYK
jgi:uncharacterized protein YdeI (YjbR/CyaY-like superfamily)